MLFLVLGLLAGPLAAAPCDLSKSARIREVLEGLDSAQRPMLAGAWLSEACRLPDALDAVLNDVSRVAPPQLRHIVMSAAAADPALLVAACTGGPAVLAGAVAAAPGDDRALLFDGCGLARHRAADRAAFLAATGGEPILYVLAAHAVGPAATDPGIREALRALAGLPSPKAPRPVVVPHRL